VSAARNVYDLLAPHYREYSGRRETYLRAVDRFVIEQAPRGAKSLLDVGAGDGIRGLALAKALGVETIVFCDNSAEMAARCRQLGAAEVWNCPAEQLPQSTQRFDVIVCLWNVLGHLPTNRARVRALRAMRRLLSAGGVLFLDVNNRHNAPAYGWLRVAGRMSLDAMRPDPRRGDAAIEWNIAGQRIPGSGHLFTAGEVERLFRAGRLRVDVRTAIDYSTGMASRWIFRGQLVYRLTARREQ
jgi:SAM-dependent methyltransferase